MRVDRMLSNVTGRPDHDWKTTMTRKATAPTITAVRCLLTFTARSAQVDRARAAPPPGHNGRLRLIELDGGHVLAALHLHEREAPVELLATHIGGPEHPLAADRGPEVVDLRRLLEEAGAGQAVVAVRLHDVVDHVTEEQTRRPRLRAEAVGLGTTPHVLQERVDGLVLLRFLERDEEQRRVLTVDVRTALAEELGVVALEGTTPDLDGVDTLDLRFLSKLHRALVVRDALGVRGALVLHGLRDGRVVALGRERRLPDRLFVGLDARLLLAHGDRQGCGDRGPQVARDHPDAMEVLVLRLEVVDLTHTGLVRLRLLVLRRAVERGRDHRVRDRRALVRHLRLQGGDVGQAGHLPGLVDAGLERLNVVQEERARANDGEVLLARLDHGIAGLVGAQLRVDEIDLDVAPGQLALGAVDVLPERLDPVDDPLEEARASRVDDVRDHRNPDRVGGDADLAVRRSALVGLLSPGRRRDQSRADPQCDGHHCPQDPLHRSPLATVSSPPGRPGAGHCVPNRNVFQDGGRPRMVSPMASPVAERAPAGAIDLLEGDLYAGDPNPTYAWLRRHAPVYRDEINHLWGISRYQDVVAIEKDPATFCSSEGYRPNIPADDSMIGNDDPRHNERRRLVARGFTPQAVAGHEDEGRDILGRLIDAGADRG